MNLIQELVSVLAPGNIPWILIGGGLACFSWLLKRWSRTLGAFLSAVGFFIGLIALSVGVKGFIWNVTDTFSSGLLLLVGITLFLNPLKNIRWATLLGLGVGILGAYLGWIILGLQNTIILFIIFLIGTLLGYLVFKFAEDLLHIVASILAFSPITTIVGVACLVQGFLLLAGSSLTRYLPDWFLHPR
jgi:hypothetical protein